MVEPRTYSIADLVRLTGFDRRTIVYYIQLGLLPRAGRRGPHTRYPERCLLTLRFVRGLKDLQDQGRCGTITLAEMRRLVERLDDQRMRALLERHLPPEEIAALQQELAPSPEAPSPEAPAPETPPRPLAAAAPPAGGGAQPLRAVPVSTPAPVGDRRSYGLADAAVRRRVAAPGAMPGTAAPAVAGRQEPGIPEPEPASAGPRPPDAGATVAQTRAAPEPFAAPPAPAGGGAPAPGPGEMPQDLGELLRELEIRPALDGRRLPPGASEQWTEIPITSRIYLSVRGLTAADAPLADAAGRALRRLLRTR